MKRKTNKRQEKILIPTDDFEELRKEEDNEIEVNSPISTIDSDALGKKGIDSDLIEERKRKKTLKKKQNLRKLAPFLIFMGCGIIILCILLALRSNKSICEFIANKVMKDINVFVGGISKSLPFSAFEFFVVFCLCLLFILIVIMIILAVKRKGIISMKILCSIIGIAFLFGSYYVLVAGFAYNRKEIPAFCPDYSPKYWDYYDIAKWYREDYVALGEKMEREENGLSVCPYTFDELSELLKNEVKRLEGEYNVEACFSVKPMKFFSQFMSDMRITGITFMPTGDCGVNSLMPSVEFASTGMHEMMHSIGIMRENEANFMACYLLISSENEYLRYCGYIEFYGYLYQGLIINATAEELNSIGLSNKIYKENQLIYDYWSSQKSITDKIGDFFNDLYLKLSGQKEGTGSYTEPTKPGEGSYEEGDRVFVDVAYNNFQQAFIKNYLEKNE